MIFNFRFPFYKREKPTRKPNLSKKEVEDYFIQLENNKPDNKLKNKPLNEPAYELANVPEKRQAIEPFYEPADKPVNKSEIEPANEPKNKYYSIVEHL